MSKPQHILQQKHQHRGDHQDAQDAAHHGYHHAVVVVVIALDPAAYGGGGNVDQRQDEQRHRNDQQHARDFVLQRPQHRPQLKKTDGERKHDGEDHQPAGFAQAFQRCGKRKLPHGIGLVGNPFRQPRHADAQRKANQRNADEGGPGDEAGMLEQRAEDVDEVLPAVILIESRRQRLYGVEQRGGTADGFLREQPAVIVIQSQGDLRIRRWLCRLPHPGVRHAARKVLEPHVAGLLRIFDARQLSRRQRPEALQHGAQRIGLFGGRAGRHAGKRAMVSHTVITAIHQVHRLHEGHHGMAWACLRIEARFLDQVALLAGLQLLDQQAAAGMDRVHHVRIQAGPLRYRRTTGPAAGR